MNKNNISFFNKIKKYKMMCFFTVLNVFLILLDQFIKWIVEGNMNLHDSFIVVSDFLRITYLQNYGAAFSILSGQKIILIIVTLLIICFLILFVIKKQIKDLFYFISITMITSGGIGNLIDRIFRGYVVDYFDVTFWPFNDFAIFNFADCLVVVGVVIFVIKFIINEFVQNKNN